jgi:hypothetical protein
MLLSNQHQVRYHNQSIYPQSETVLTNTPLLAPNPTVGNSILTSVQPNEIASIAAIHPISGTTQNILFFPTNYVLELELSSLPSGQWVIQILLQNGN